MRSPVSVRLNIKDNKPGSKGAKHPNRIRLQEFGPRNKKANGPIRAQLAQSKKNKRNNNKEKRNRKKRKEEPKKKREEKKREKKKKKRRVERKREKGKGRGESFVLSFAFFCYYYSFLKLLFV